MAMATVSDVQFSHLGAAAALASACMSAMLKVRGSRYGSPIKGGGETS